jgi:hypothetical protein
MDIKKIVVTTGVTAISAWMGTLLYSKSLTWFKKSNGESWTAFSTKGLGASALLTGGAGLIATMYLYNGRGNFSRLRGLAQC